MTEAPPDLADFLDAVIRGDTAPAGFAGTICVGIEAGSAIRWWEVELGGRVQARFVPKPSEAVQAGLVLTAAASQAILSKRSPLPDEGIRVFGDAALLTRFIDRYLRQLSPLMLRVQGSGV